MLKVNNLTLNFKKDFSAKGIIRSLGLMNNLVLCLDSADRNSYPGSGQTLFDVSGNGNNFFLGGTGSSEGSDPTYNGVPNRFSKSDFFSFDGGDVFTEASVLTFAEDWHKNSAIFTIAAAWFQTNFGYPIFCSFNDLNGETGISFYVAASVNPGELGMRVGNGGNSGNAYDARCGVIVPNNQWVFLALAVDESTNSASFYVDSTVVDVTYTYNLPTTGGSTDPYTIGNFSGAGGAAPAGSKFGALAAWSARLSTQELNSLRIQLMSRYK